ncbi:hypothetical protein C8R47DRAFT_1063088 [Mycena vitilis]|nr:hypothetical protein C8R47DRAFT_1063088 [Mycena vitilis]
MYISSYPVKRKYPAPVGLRGLVREFKMKAVARKLVALSRVEWNTSALPLPIEWLLHPLPDVYFILPGKAKNSSPLGLRGLVREFKLKAVARKLVALSRVEWLDPESNGRSCGFISHSANGMQLSGGIDKSRIEATQSLSPSRTGASADYPRKEPVNEYRRAPRSNRYRAILSLTWILEWICSESHFKVLGLGDSVIVALNCIVEAMGKSVNRNVSRN